MTEQMAYAGYCKGCGQMIAVTADYPGREKETAKDVAKMISQGLEIKRVTKETVKREFNECLCKKKQGELFA